MQSASANKQLYFIAIVIPEEGARQVTAIKEYFREHHGSKAALRSPPHITLHMPFSWPDKKLDQLLRFLQTFAVDQDPMELTLRNFKSFPPRVIYIDVLQQPKLVKLQELLLVEAHSKLKVYNANYKDRPFVPHVTVAFRDLKKAEFKKAWKTFEMKQFRYQFLVTDISLLRHTGRVWEVYNNFTFKAF